MEFNGFPQSVAKDDRNRLPDDLHKFNSVEISAPFGQHDDGLPRRLHGILHKYWFVVYRTVVRVKITCTLVVLLL